jgi:hypothetical protein
LDGDYNEAAARFALRYAVIYVLLDCFESWKRVGET